MQAVRNQFSRGALVAVVSALCSSFLTASVIRVPQDHVLISRAVAAAKDGDIVEVDDGFYFEKNIVVDKAIVLRAKNMFGAAVYGAAEPGAAIFIIRAACEIEGFILKNSNVGLLQRDSPDVLWTGRNLALFNMEEGISINDRTACRGSARLTDIITDGCRVAFVTNDARSFDISRVLVANAAVAFSGSHHLSYKVSDVVAWNCRTLAQEEARITLGSGIDCFNASNIKKKAGDLQRRLNALFVGENGQPPLQNAKGRRREALMLVITGDIFLQAGNPRGAALHFQTAQAMTKSDFSGEVAWHALYGLAQSAEARGDRTEAVNFYKKAVEIIEDIGLGLPIQTFQSSFRKDKIGIYETLIGLLMDLHWENPSRGYDREAFLFAEKSKARGFLAGLEMAGAGSDRPEGVDREHDLNAAVTRLQIELQNPDLAPERRTELFSELERAENDRRAFNIEIRKRGAQALRCRISPPGGFEEIRTKLLRPDVALLEYVLGEAKSFAFLTTADGLWIAKLPSESNLRPRIANFLKFLTLRESKDFRGAAGGRALAEDLLAPFRERLDRGVKSLYIIPDGILHYLPFETLIRTYDGRDRFLIEDFEIAYGPSASGLIQIADRPGSKAFPMDFLGVANPNPLRAFGLSGQEEIVFPRLPYAVREIRTIRNYFKRERTTLLLGRDAREDAFKALPLADYRVIHIVAHGFFDDRNWQRSALVLLRDSSGEDDGFVQSNDIFPLRIQPDLLVLSGCETGVGLLEKGEGLNGLSFAFFYAGARSILLSLWSVNDKAASVFMESFYRHFTAGINKTEALRKAKLEMLSSKYRHPFYWAPFVLQGR